MAKLLAFDADFLLQLFQKRFVVLADRLDEARDQQFTGRLRPFQETGYEVARQFVLPLTTRKAWCIDERAFRFASVQQSFLEEPVKRRHDGGVGKRTAKALRDVADVALAAGPQQLHEGHFE